MNRIAICFLFLFAAVTMSGCATFEGTVQSARLAILPGTPFEQGKYTEQIAYLEGPYGSFATEGKRRAALNNLFGEYRRNKYFISSTTFLQQRYEYAYSLIECGQHAKAIKVCIEGINECKILHDFVVQNRPKQFSEAISKVIVDTASDSADEWLFREQMGKLKQLASYAVWFGTGDTAKARYFFEGSLEDVPKHRIAPYHITRAAFYQKILGDNPLALKEIDTALTMTASMAIMKSDVKNEYLIKAYLRQTDLYLKLGQLQKSLENMEKQQAAKDTDLFSIRDTIVGKMPVFRGPFSTYHSLAGGVYAALREFGPAKKQFDKSWEYIKEVDGKNTSDRQALAAYHIMYGAYYLGLQGKYAEAAGQVEKGIAHLRPTFVESIESVVDLESANLLAAELNYLGGDRKKAEVQARKSYEESGRYRNRVTAGAAMTLLGKICLDDGRIEPAKQYFEEALKRMGDTDNTENWKLFYGLGRAYEASGKTEEALAYYQKAVGEVEKLWSGRFRDTQKQVSFIDNRMVVFEPVIRLLAKRGKAQDAVGYMERAKARAFFETSIFVPSDSSAQADAPVPAAIPESDEMERIDQEAREIGEKITPLKASIKEMDERLAAKPVSAPTKRGVALRKGKPSSSAAPTPKNLSKKERAQLIAERASKNKTVQELEKRLGAIAKRKETLQAQIPAGAPIGKDSRPLTAAQVRILLDRETAILEYYVGEKVVVGAIVTAAGVAVRELPLDAASLKKKVLDFRSQIEEIDVDCEILGAALYDALLKPFEERLAGMKRLCFIPHGILHYLPFQALVTSDRKEIPPQLVLRERELVQFLALRNVSSGRGMKIQAKKAASSGESSEKLTAELASIRQEIARQQRQKKTGPGPEYLIGKYEVVYGPSATVLGQIRRQEKRTGEEKLLALGSPPTVDVSDMNMKDGEGNRVLQMEQLTHAKAEVQQVADLFPEKALYTDEAATESMVKSFGPQSGVILLSAHGLLYRQAPLQSSIFLYKDDRNDGRLTVAEVEGIKLNARLVVLSACESGLVGGYEGIPEEIREMKFPYGDDLVGLQRGFIKAGASSVLSTLWSVSDESTAKLIFTFFEQYRKTGEKAKALRDAELTLIADSRWTHPFFWAPFVLSGDWK